MAWWRHAGNYFQCLKYRCGLWKPEHWFHIGQSPPAQRWRKKGAEGHETNQQIGKSRGGNTTKIHAVVDGIGNPIYFQLSAGNVNDSTVAIDVLSHIELSGSNVLGDKAYGIVAIRKYITSRGATYTIPPKSNTVTPWECDFHVYKERHLIECFFNKLKHFRRIATRYDKLANLRISTNGVSLYLIS